MKHIPLIIAVGALVAVAATGAQLWSSGAAPSTPPGDQAAVTGGEAARPASPLLPVAAPNVSRVAEAWRFDVAGGVTQAPLVVDGVMYVAGHGRVIAIDGDTGAQLWETQVPANANARPMSYAGKSGKQYVAIMAGTTVMVYGLSP